MKLSRRSEVRFVMKGMYVLSGDAYEKIYGPREREENGGLVEIIGPQQTAESINADRSSLAEIDVIISGWGMAELDEDFLTAAPRLKAIFYGASSVKYFMTENAWDREIVVSSAYGANAIPTAEYALSQILFSLKRGWHFARTIERKKRYPDSKRSPGAYKSTVGIVSLGMIGSHVARLLQSFDISVLAYSSNEEKAHRLGAKPSSLDEIFSRSDVVSLHTPLLPETEGMITAQHLSSMKQEATLINTARGVIVRQAELIEVLRQRPDLYAILDVTNPDPPESGSSLFLLPNVVLTPHIAGSVGAECRRLGRYMVDELRRFTNDEPLRWRINREDMARLA